VTVRLFGISGDDWRPKRQALPQSPPPPCKQSLHMRQRRSPPGSTRTIQHHHKSSPNFCNTILSFHSQPDASFETHFVCQKLAWEPCCSTRHAQPEIAPVAIPRRNAASAFELASRDLKCPPLALPMHGMYGKGNSTQSSLCVSLEKMKSTSCLKMRRNATSPSSRLVWRRLRKS
jgi:hypothetical protein